MNQDIQIGNRLIGKAHKPFVIAELSGNHNQSLARALSIVDAAAAAGVDALKLQTYTADTMTLNMSRDDFMISDPASLWDGNSLYKLYQEGYTPWEWHEAIFNRCKEHDILPFSTPFDPTAVDFLESLQVPAYKIASFENTDLPLIRKVASMGKPVILSTGMATIAELDEAVRTIHEAGCHDLVLLKCTSAYPALPDNSNLLTIPHLSELFNCQVGISDHTLGIGASIASVVLGGTVIEKHFTLARADGGLDSAFSMEPGEMKLLVSEAIQAWQSLGRIQYGPSLAEQASIKYRRSLFVVTDMKKGEAFSSDNVRAIRPGTGLPPKFIDMVIGRTANRDITKGSPFDWELI